MSENERTEGRHASPLCKAGEVAPDSFDPLGVDPEAARDIARWRRARAGAAARRTPGAQRGGARCRE